MSKKMFEGKVVSTKMEKTVVVAVDIVKAHPMYEKAVTRTRKFKARDELGVKVNDIVRIEECPPFSKEVTWKVVEVVGEGEA